MLTREVVAEVVPAAAEVVLAGVSAKPEVVPTVTPEVVPTAAPEVVPGVAARFEAVATDGVVGGWLSSKEPQPLQPLSTGQRQI